MIYNIYSVLIVLTFELGDLLDIGGGEEGLITLLFALIHYTAYIVTKKPWCIPSRYILNTIVTNLSTTTI